jgi:hypothetical protein
MAVLTPRISIQNAIGWLEQALLLLQEVEKPQPDSGQNSTKDQELVQQKVAWGAKVSPVFKGRVLWIADSLGCSPDDLMACMAWESAESFRADIKNAAGSGAVGLIQFMPSTAKGLGTSSADLANMTPEDQLRFVYEYFKPFAGVLHNLGDVYMAILWPKGIGKPDSFVLFDRAATPVTFRQNAGLDSNHNGSVTRAECLVKINQKLAKGMQEGYVG